MGHCSIRGNNCVTINSASQGGLQATEQNVGTDKEYMSANNEEMLVVLSLNKNNGLNQPKVLSCLDEAVDKRLLQQGLNSGR